MDQRNETTIPAWCKWPTGPDNPILLPNEVHVWCARLDMTAERDRLNAWLSDDEKTRAQRFHFERDRARFIVRRGVLRALVGLYAGVHPAHVRFTYSKRGKPQLMPPLGFEFNLSHSHELGLFAFAQHRPVGVDIEKLRSLDDLPAIAERFFSEKENAAFNTVEEGQKVDAFFNCWTRKEAVLKTTGEGLQTPLNSFDVALLPGEPARLLRFAGSRSPAWLLHSLEPAGGFIGAVAAQGEQWVLRCWAFPESGQF